MQYYPQQQPMNNYGGMPMCIPSNPIGNIAPLGYGGMYGGYYTGNYNRYDPYYLQQQKELQLAQQREDQRTQSSIFKKLYKTSSNCLGLAITEEDLGRFDPQFDEDLTTGMNQEEMETYYYLQRRDEYMNYHQQQISAMQGNSIPCMSTQGYAYNQAYNQMYDKAKKEIPDDVGLAEYLEKYAPKKIMEAYEQDQKKAQADLTKLYNKTDYNELIKSNRSIFGSTVFNPDASIDDQEIRLPNLISERTRQERRAQFLNAIVGNGGI